MVTLFHRAAELLNPISARLLERIAQSALVQADETPLRVLAKRKTRTGYLWTFLAGKDIGYRYSSSRSGATPEAVLGGTNGDLVVDAFTGYRQRRLIRRPFREGSYTEREVAECVHLSGTHWWPVYQSLYRWDT